MFYRPLEVIGPYIWIFMQCIFFEIAFCSIPVYVSITDRDFKNDKNT